MSETTKTYEGRRGLKKRYFPVKVRGGRVIVDLETEGKGGVITAYRGSRGLEADVTKAVKNRFGLKRVELAA